VATRRKSFLLALLLAVAACGGSETASDPQVVTSEVGSIDRVASVPESLPAETAEVAEPESATDDDPGLPDAAEVRRLDSIVKSVNLASAQASPNWATNKFDPENVDSCVIDNASVLAVFESVGVALEVSEFSHSRAGSWGDESYQCSFTGSDDSTVSIRISLDGPDDIEQYLDSDDRADRRDEYTVYPDDVVPVMVHRFGFFDDSDQGFVVWVDNDTSVSISGPLVSPETARLAMERLLQAILDAYPAVAASPVAPVPQIDSSAIIAAFPAFADDVGERGECRLIGGDGTRAFLDLYDPGAPVENVLENWFGNSALCFVGPLIVEAKLSPYDSQEEWLTSYDTFTRDTAETRGTERPDFTATAPGLPDEVVFTRGGEVGVFSDEFIVTFSFGSTGPPLPDMLDALAAGYFDVVEHITSPETTSPYRLGETSNLEPSQANDQRRVEFHVITDVGWEYDVAVTFERPMVSLSKDITQSPPGQAALTALVTPPLIEFNGTIDGRTAPDILPNTRPAVFYDLQEPVNGPGGACDGREGQLRCPAPLTTAIDPEPLSYSADGWLEDEVDRLIAEVNDSDPVLFFMELQGPAFDLGKCSVRIFSDGTVDNGDPYTSGTARSCTVGPVGTG